jgi:hypothetical protein
MLMRLFVGAAFLLSLVNYAMAQPAQRYAPPDEDLWNAMVRALQDRVNAPAAAHQVIQQILADVQREAQMRETRAKAEKKPEPPK